MHLVLEEGKNKWQKLSQSMRAAAEQENRSLFQMLSLTTSIKKLNSFYST
jgi:hypothetical protein